MTKPTRALFWSSLALAFFLGGSWYLAGMISDDIAAAEEAKDGVR